jgi:hypothetical protein
MSLFTSATESLAAIDMLVWTKVRLPKVKFIVDHSNLDVPDHCQNQTCAIR